ncbi:uncharacterized protein [Haliotis cracherodii]|uniref:uncharacterized protein n=1 Tax=Haliotis cracherodii TaxID=6455 RepID=UPI0039E9FE16
MSNVTINKDEVQSERIIQLNKERASIQSAFTRTENQINGFIVNKNASPTDIEHVEGSVKSIEKIFDSLTQKVNQLKEIVQDDAEEISKLEMYMNKMSDRLKTVMSSVQMWHHDTVKRSDSASQVGSHASSGSTRSKIAARRAALKVKHSALKESQELKLKKFELELQEETLQMETELAAANAQYEMLHLLQLPKVEIMKFDGNPLQYWAFIRSFDISIGETSISNSAKLNRLLQYCTGHVQEVIECCVIINPEIGYFQARKLLLERFGNQYVIAKAWVDKVTDVPNLKPNDSAGLRRYADSVRSCVVSLTAMSRLGKIDNQLRMRKIVEKLPFFIQSKWRKEAVNVLKCNGQYPGIGHLAEFIEIAAEELDDPVFGINMPVLEGSAVSQFDVDKWKHFQGIDLPMVEGKFAKVTVLIGQYNPLVLTPIEVRSGKADEPYATKTIFGWAINGPLHTGIKQGMTSNFVQVEATLESQVEKFWHLDNSGTSDKKPGKFRIVFDCSAKFGGISLNESVHQGPDLTNTSQCNALRFLWWKNGELGGDIEVYRMTSHLFGGIWSSICANYALRKTAADNADDFDKDTIQTVTDNFYVDDCLKSVDSKEKGIKLVQNVCDLLQRGGFRLTKWTSNSRTVLQSIPVEERVKELKDINLCDDELPLEKALGVK